MSFNFGTPATTTSTAPQFGTPGGDAKTTKAEFSQFGSTATTQSNGSFNFNLPTTGGILGSPSTQSGSLFETATFGKPNQTTSSAFGTRHPIFAASLSVTPSLEGPKQTTVPQTFGDTVLTTPGPQTSGAGALSVGPTFNSTERIVAPTCYASSGSGVLGTAFQPTASEFVSAGQSINTPSFGIPQSTFPTFASTTQAVANRLGVSTQSAMPSFGMTSQVTAVPSFGSTPFTSVPQFSFSTTSLAKPKTTSSTICFAPALPTPSFTTTAIQPTTQPTMPLHLGFPSTFMLGSTPTSSHVASATTTTNTITASVVATTITTMTSSTCPTTAAAPIKIATAPLEFGSHTSSVIIPTAGNVGTTAPTRIAISTGVTINGTDLGTTKSVTPSLSTFGNSATSINIAPTTLSFGVTSTNTITPIALNSYSVPTTSTTTVLTPYTSVVPCTSSIATAFNSEGTKAKTNPSTISASNLISNTKMTYGQLEDLINKWTLDLENQSKIFANQARQLNAWDRLLISNGDKILSLNNSIEHVKEQQHHLDQELDFIRSQQKELENLIVPLEKELQVIPVTDTDRNHTYQLAENMDSQLKQMSEDLKEIIETLNESNKNEELANPITQIGRILNAHMNSLQWIDLNTNKISTHLDQISKMHDVNRRNHEIVFQRTYD